MVDEFIEDSSLSPVSLDAVPDDLEVIFDSDVIDELAGGSRVPGPRPGWDSCFEDREWSADDPEGSDDVSSNTDVSTSGSDADDDEFGDNDESLISGECSITSLGALRSSYMSHKDV